MKAQINILAYCLISILGLGSLIFSQTIKTLTVPQGTKILAELETTLNSRTSRQHDRFSATVTESIFVEGIEVIPIGTSLMGKVVRVKKSRSHQAQSGNESRIRILIVAQWSY